MSIIFDKNNKQQSEILQKLDDKFLNGDIDNKHIKALNLFSVDKNKEKL